MAKPIQFLKETKAEMKHVVWPTKRRALIYTLIIILFSLVVGYTLGGFDLLFRSIMKTLIIQ